MLARAARVLRRCQLGAHAPRRSKASLSQVLGQPAWSLRKLESPGEHSEAVSEEELDHLLRLSLLSGAKLSAAERAGLKQDLAAILAFARMVQAEAHRLGDEPREALWQGDLPLSLSASDCLPDPDKLPDEASTLHTLRDDAIEGVLPRDSLLESAPQSEHGFFSVPKTMQR